MDLGLTDRVAFVGGASAGLGRAIARRLAKEGCRVAICARRPDVLESLARELKTDFGADVSVATGDLADTGSIVTLVRESATELGPIDVLVTNVGGPPAGQFDDLEPAAWNRALDLLLHSVLTLSREVLPSMKEKGWGRIINVTSVAVKQPVDNLMLSNSIRAAVTGFARTLANEVARDGITVNNVMPGYTRTERLEELAAGAAARQGIDASAVFAKWEEETPAGRLGEPEELAALVAFLASKHAAYITGTSTPVDGGWIRGLV